MLFRQKAHLHGDVITHTNERSPRTHVRQTQRTAVWGHVDLSVSGSVRSLDTFVVTLKNNLIGVRVQTFIRSALLQMCIYGATCMHAWLGFTSLLHSLANSL